VTAATITKLRLITRMAFTLSVSPLDPTASTPPTTSPCASSTGAATAHPYPAGDDPPILGEPAIPSWTPAAADGGEPWVRVRTRRRPSCRHQMRQRGPTATSEQLRFDASISAPKLPPSAAEESGDVGASDVKQRPSVPALAATSSAWRRNRCCRSSSVNTISCWPLLDSNGELVTRSSTTDNTGRWSNAHSLARRQRPLSSPLPRRRTQPPRSHHPRRRHQPQTSRNSVSAGTTTGTSLPETRGPGRQTRDLSTGSTQPA
jgi:hypothetical protein